jgi:hypothetical protein
MQFGEEPGKQKTRSCRAQELARTVPREMRGGKKGGLRNSAQVVSGREQKDTAHWEKWFLRLPFGSLEAIGRVADANVRFANEFRRSMSAWKMPLRGLRILLGGLRRVVEFR